MRQAIKTVGISPTNYHGARIKASCLAGHCTCPWDHELSIDENHLACLQVLLTKLGWQSWEWHSGWAADGSMVHVTTD